jgi:hypothetical protein
MFGFKVICWALLFIFKLFVLFYFILFYHIAISSVTETVNSIRDKRIQFCVTGGAVPLFASTFNTFHVVHNV